MNEAEKITRGSRSNLALAFLSLPAQKRRDITTFYAFCRVVDDIADEPGAPVEERQAQLDLWRCALLQPTAGEHLIAADLRELLQRYAISSDLLGDILSGMEMDLRATRFATLAELQLYCYRVAGAVGLVSIEIFGYRHPSAKKHALALGEALQLTNILRDVGADYRNGQRIYLPADLLRRHHYTEADLAAGICDARFHAVMSELGTVAEAQFRVSDSALDPEDRRPLRPGLIMGDIYRRILQKMRQKKFRVFSEKVRLTKIEMLAHVLRRTFLSR